MASNKMAIGGIGFLAAAMTGAVMLIADFIYNPTPTIIGGVMAAVIFGMLWSRSPSSCLAGLDGDVGAGSRRLPAAA